MFYKEEQKPADLKRKHENEEILKFGMEHRSVDFISERIIEETNFWRKLNKNFEDDGLLIILIVHQEVLDLRQLSHGGLVAFSE